MHQRRIGGRRGRSERRAKRIRQGEEFIKEIHKENGAEQIEEEKNGEIWKEVTSKKKNKKMSFARS